MSSAIHLLDQARSLCRRRGRARNADLKRATSTIYYALFHALAGEFADTLIGSKHRLTEPWIRVYRALDHSKARQEFRRLSSVGYNKPKFDSISEKFLFEVAILFVELQELRHFADYDPRPSELSREGVVQFAMRVDGILEVFDLINQDNWRELATAVLLKERK